MTSPPDRTAEAYRAHIRELAQAKRRPRPDRKRQHRDRAAPDRRPYPWPVDSELDHD